MNRKVKEFESIDKALAFLSYKGQDIIRKILTLSVDELGITLSEMNNILCAVKTGNFKNLNLCDVEAIITCLKKIPYESLQHCSGNVASLEEEFTKVKDSIYSSETI